MTNVPRRQKVASNGEIKCVFSSDGLRLKGTLHISDQPFPNLVIGSHGLYSSGDSPKQVALALACSRMGVAYFRFDHRGCGRSEGRFEDVTSLAGRRRDLVDAAAFLRTEFPLGDGLGLFGSSFGGAASLAAAPLLSPIRIVTLAAPVDSRSILSAAEESPPVEPLFLGPAFQFDLRGDLRSIADLLVIHGEDDAVVPAEHAQVIYNGARDPKRLLIIPGGDHRLSQKTHQQRFMEAAVAWFQPLEPSTDYSEFVHAEH